MTDHPTPPPDEITREVAPVPPPPPAAPPPANRGRRLGHVVLGAVLILIGVGWLLEALDVADVPWRFLLPSALILVGLALALGARSGRHGGLLAVGVVLTVMVLAAGAVEMLADVPLSGGMGDRDHRPQAVPEAEYRWGMGKMTIDLSEARDLPGREVAASVVMGELVVIVPEDVALRITAHAGLGEVSVLGTTTGGVDVGLECAGRGARVACGSADGGAELAFRLDLRVALGQVEVRR